MGIIRSGCNQNVDGYYVLHRLRQEAANMIDGDKHEDTFDDAADEEITFEPYTADDFLTDVYMDEDRYKVLKSLLLTKRM